MEKTKSLSRYFSAIKDLNPLTKEEELQLGERAQAGDRSAINKLIEHNLKIVVKIANKNIGRGISVDDLIQQGNLGLYEAAIKYDPSVGVRFATFAGTRILKSMNSLIDTCGRAVRIPVNQEYKRYLAIKNGDDVENISSVELDKLIRDSDKSIGTTGILATPSGIYEEYDKIDLKIRVTSALDVLSDRDREIIKMFYGIDREDSFSSSEIAAIVGLTQIRVCQIVKSAKDKMKNNIKMYA